MTTHELARLLLDGPDLPAILSRHGELVELVSVEPYEWDEDLMGWFPAEGEAPPEGMTDPAVRLV